MTITECSTWNIKIDQFGNNENRFSCPTKPCRLCSPRESYNRNMLILRGLPFLLCPIKNNLNSHTIEITIVNLSFLSIDWSWINWTVLYYSLHYVMLSLYQPTLSLSIVPLLSLFTFKLSPNWRYSANNKTRDTNGDTIHDNVREPCPPILHVTLIPGQV